ncbi:hypothetical protein BDZ91DRAFT_778292 [Kalaharituber pfeilii]|nr:hypothetical protein BDZ91DRAFT_778292 [Kalaharituber pfeilii]
MRLRERAGVDARTKQPTCCGQARESGSLKAGGGQSRVVPSDVASVGALGNGGAEIFVLPEGEAVHAASFLLRHVQQHSFLLAAVARAPLPLAGYETWSLVRNDQMRGAMMGAVFAMQLKAAQTYDECQGSCKIVVDRMWRIVIGFGAIPACIALYYRLTIPETPRYTFDVARDIEKASADASTYLQGQSTGEIDEIRQIEARAAAQEQLVVPKASWKDFGYITVTMFTVDTLGRKPIQLMGFVLLTGLFFGIVVYLPSMFSAKFFFNFRPNATTFIVPGECFPMRYRSTSHGISAASGTIGAILAQVLVGLLRTRGATLENDSPWLDNVMKIFAGFMAVGILTSLLIPETKRMTLEEITLELYGEGELVTVVEGDDARNRDGEEAELKK